MLFCAKADTAAVKTADAGKIRLGGGFRLPVTTADIGKIRLGGGFRLPATPEHTLGRLDTILKVRGKED
jgi:hypothetical protein